MSEIAVVKQASLSLDEREKETMRRVLFESMDGLGERSKKSWRRFWSRLIKAEIGELFTVALVFRRNPKFHRKFFALLNFGFEHWEPGRKKKLHKGKPVSKNFDHFREEVTILAGYYEQTFDLKGRFRLAAQSIAFDKMDEAEFERLYNAVADVILQHVLPTFCERAELDALIDKWAGFV